MKLKEAYEIICRCPYCFSDDELEFDISEGVRDGETLAMIWIIQYKTLPPPELIHDPSIQEKYGLDMVC